MIPAQNNSGSLIVNNDEIPGSYPGGKNSCGVYQLVINEIRPHNLLIIPFLGKCGVLSHIKIKKAIGIDRDERVIRYWNRLNIPCTHFICADAISNLPAIISKYADSGSIVIYADPPYPIQSRKTKRAIYKYELTDKDHSSFLELMLQLKCDVLIHTMPNDLYATMLKDWRCIKYKAQTRGGKANELLYLNYENKEGLLHDYRYLGKNFREREWIRNRIKRFTAKLNSLPPKVKNAIIETANEFRKIDNHFYRQT